MVEYLELSIDELLLDQENPRLGKTASQNETLEAIIRLNESHFRNLMISIKDEGLDPGDNLYVIDSHDDNDFIVLEGNRRLSALIILNNPDRLKVLDVSDSLRKSLSRVSKGFERQSVEPIRCVWFPNRSDAQPWIYRRHTNTAGGEGRIPWGPLDIKRFTGDRFVLDMIEFVGRNADFSDEDWSATQSIIESNKSSNLERFFDSKACRQHLRLASTKIDDEVVPTLGTEPKWALKVLRRIIEDVRDGVIDSRTYNKASDISAYFDELPSTLQPPKKKPAKPQVISNITFRSAKKTENQVDQKSEKANRSKLPRRRKTLAPKRHPFQFPDSTKGQQLLREAGLIDADKLPISAAFTLRAFIELAVHDYMKSHDLPFSEKTKGGKSQEIDLSTRTERVVQHIVASKLATNNDFRGFRNSIMTKTSHCSIQSLSGFVHNKWQVPIADALRSGWDSSVPLFIAAYGSAK